MSYTQFNMLPGSTPGEDRMYRGTNPDFVAGQEDKLGMVRLPALACQIVKTWQRQPETGVYAVDTNWYQDTNTWILTIGGYMQCLDKELEDIMDDVSKFLEGYKWFGAEIRIGTVGMEEAGISVSIYVSGPFAVLEEPYTEKEQD